MEKISVTELRAKIYKVTSEARRTGEAIIITDHGEPAWKLVPIKKNAAKAKAATNQETIWERFERLGPRKIMIADDIEHFSAWDETAWEKKWEKRPEK